MKDKKEKQSLIVNAEEDISTEIKNEEDSTSKKLDLQDVEFVFEALSCAFMPYQNDGNEDFDMKFHSLWSLFLVCSGWNEEEFWEEIENQKCNNCTCDCHDDDITDEEDSKNSDIEHESATEKLSN